MKTSTDLLQQSLVAAASAPHCDSGAARRPQLPFIQNPAARIATIAKGRINRVFSATVLALSSATLSSCAATAAAPEPLAPVSNVQPLPAAPRLPRALWVWNASVITDAKKQNELFDFCARKNISVVYLSVGDIFSERQREATDPKHVTAPVLGQFLQAAHARKLQVEALDGDPEFALEAKHAEALAIFQKALAYNKNAAPDEKLDGFQWDTEPYLLKEFQAGGASQKQVLAQYLDSVAQMRDALQKNPLLTLGYAIPAFFDDSERILEWGGKSQPVAFHLMDVLQTLPSSYVVMMAYRDRALGANGTVEIIRGEVDYATKSAPKVKVWVGQETIDVTGDPPSITFFQEGENALEQALGQIQTAYGDKPVVAGFSIHHFDSYRVMKAGDAIAPVAPVTEPLSILTPKADAPVARRTEVSGTAKPGGEGVKIEVAVRPQGDIWYPQGEVALSPDGSWSVTANFGNEATPAASSFEVRAQLKRADGSVVIEQIVTVQRG